MKSDQYIWIWIFFDLYNFKLHKSQVTVCVVVSAVAW